MAALFEHPPIPLLELRTVKAPYLDPLLEEEGQAWISELDWDYSASSALVRRFVGMRALSGFVLPGDDRAAGYAYYVVDEGKGLIGGLYVTPSYRNADNENALIAASLEAMWRISGTRRVEAQLIMLSDPLRRNLPYTRWFEPYTRRFLEAPLESLTNLEPRKLPVTISPWNEQIQEDAAWMIAAGYSGHIDSRINDQYRTVWGARRFLGNIIQYPGCGTFSPQASFLARDRKEGGLAGLCLASVVSKGSLGGVGHITQLCLAPSHRGIGLGYELLRRSLAALAEQGCHKVSLTVTAANREATRLYDRLGFTNRRDFAAYVWERR